MQIEAVTYNAVVVKQQVAIKEEEKMDLWFYGLTFV